MADSKSTEQQQHVHPDAGQLRELAVRAGVDPRTLIKTLLGHHVRGMAGHRARRVLHEAGYLRDEGGPQD